MKTSRIKSIVIAILALVNVCLLFLLISRRTQEYAARSRTVAQLVQLYAANGVALPAQLVPSEGTGLAAVEPARDLTAEKSFAGDLLGGSESEEVGGGIYRYVWESGQCLIRASGAVEAALERAVDAPAAFAEERLAAHGFSILSSNLSASGSGTVTAVRTLSGVTVFNAELTLTFRQNQLTAVNGYFLPPIEPGEGHGDGISGVTALVRFLDYSVRNGEVCGAVTDVREGYLLQSTASVSQRLIPTWCVTTDVGKYYVNSITGEVTREA